MKELIEAKDLPENEEIYLTKDFFGYRIVHPIRNKDGSINWVNMLFGGWRNLFILIIILIIVFGLYFGIQELLAGCQDLAANPCKYTSLDCSLYKGF
jgi:hypothetical protein